MSKYITGQKLLTMGLQADLEDLDEVELESLCAQASMLVDAYCSVPRLPAMHDFKGGTIVDETHDWQYPISPFDLGQRRVYTFHRPLVSVDYLRIYVSNQPLYLEVQPAHLVINPTASYMEIISLALTTSGLFNALIVPNVGLLAPIVKVGYSYGYSLAVTGDMLYETDGMTFRATNQFWKASPAPVIHKNGSIITTGFTIDRTEGVVVFDDLLTADDIVTADYTHSLPSDIMYGTAYVASFLRSGARLRQRGLGRVGSVRVAEVSISGVPSVSVDEIDQLMPEAAMYLAGYRYDHLVVR